MNERLKQAPTWRRLEAVPALSSDAPEGGRVDRTGGQFSAGLIRGVSVLTRGEALGHGFWCDAFMLSQCLSFMQEAARGLKCRFTHPGLCADGLAKGLGLFLNPALNGDQVSGDLHFNAFSHKSPDGDLASYIMDRAAEDPLHFGTSIVFCSDQDAEEEFMLANGGEWVVDEWGWKTIVGFKSPDPDNIQNYPHARIAELLACDCVDDPAANPSGLFHRDLSTIQAAEGFLDYALGLSTDRPQTVEFGVDPERARQFIMAYAKRRGFTIPEGGKMPKILKKGTGVPAKLATGDAPPPAGAKPDAPPADPKAAPTPKTEADDEVGVTCPECGCEFVPVDGDDEPSPVTEEPQQPGEYAANHKRYVDAFGVENGTTWFLGGVKFEAAQKQHFGAQLAAKDKRIQELEADLKSANEKLAAVAKDGASPLGASPPPVGTTKDAKPNGYAALFKVPTSRE